MIPAEVGSRRAIALILGLALIAACGGGGRTLSLEEQAIKEPINGTDRYRVVVTAKAAERLDIQTTAITETEFGLSAPSASLVLDIEGTFWVYVNPEPLTYERVAVGPVREEAGQAHFSTGPPPGTKVVVVGVAELYGEETGVGK